MAHVESQIPFPVKIVFGRVAATAWLNHLRCRLKRCRRVGKCLGGPPCATALPVCTRPMSDAAILEMLEFLGATLDVATPERLAACLAAAEDDEARAMVAFRREVFLHHMKELEIAGLEPPLGPPFIEEAPVKR